MKKRLVSILSIILVFIILSVGCSPKDDKDISITEKKEYPTLITEDYNNIDIEKIDNYDIDVEFYPEEKKYFGKQKVIYFNKENIPLDKVYFHVYPNAFRKKETAPFLFDDFESAYPEGFKPGYMDIKKVKVDGKDATFSIEGEDSTILKISLGKQLKPGEKTEIYMEYTGVLPPCRDRFGYGERTYNFGNWYPIAVVYDDEGWNLDPYYRIGDPFYSDVNNYTVTITVPKDMVIASSGNIKSEKINNDKKIWEIEAKLMRDFAWVGSKYFTKVEKKVDNTLVNVYLLEKDREINDFAVEVSCDSIDIFNDAFGEYPYGQYSVVETSFPSGMEYPGIVFIGEKYYNKNYKNYLEVVIAHETGHQWWYGVVGNDEVDEAWLDESITSYSEVIYVNEKYGDNSAENYYKNSTEAYYESRKAVIQANENIVKPLDEFNGWNDYGPLVYSKGAMFIHEIRERYGEKVLYEILRNYYGKYKFLNATTEDFIKICEEVTGDDFEQLVKEWLYGLN
ncbi:M1 family metallopeptidase [Thermohalobacter berrensis]|uniref:Agmatine deiminase n=1 Tax=Thermohalobacter berrensis TaxID=99594 RepID=A0A419SU10_9FIRM|nr:M1 family metallopeptidase [Thermohalobacter berrensis]RKD28763.1 agmatine deiminase [Thermohalobacter berrensis]